MNLKAVNVKILKLNSETEEQQQPTYQTEVQEFLYVGCSKAYGQVCKRIKLFFWWSDCRIHTNAKLVKENLGAGCKKFLLFKNCILSARKAMT